MNLIELDQLTTEQLEALISHRTVSITSEEIEELERSFSGSKDQLFDVLVLNFSLMCHHGLPDNDRRLKYALWIIEHFPENGICSKAPQVAQFFLEEDSYEQIMSIWRMKAKGTTNPAILINAAYATKSLEERNFFCDQALKVSSQSIETKKQIDDLNELFAESDR